MTEDEKVNSSDRSYATTVDDGVNYRDISGTMTLLGYPMNHSSARNHILRTMQRFARAFRQHWGIDTLDDGSIEGVARSSTFQTAVGEILRQIWDEKKDAGLLITDEAETQARSPEPAAPAQHDAGTLPL